jgi:serine/threonine protein kinase
MLPTGTILDGRYTITGTLGEGGFATVYRTRHQFLHSTHAIKVLLPHLASDPEMRSRFLSEGRIQAGLRHPNIIAVTDIVTDPSPGLVMEHIEGPTLTELLSERGAALHSREIAAVMLPMLDAVGIAHAAGIVHRDLKPDNVLMTRRGADFWPMIGDFGIAKILEVSKLEAAKQKTRTGMRMGTLHYMSPEQIRGASTVDARTDIFALGAILYECATGRSAFAGDSEFDTMRNIVDGRFDPPERVAAGVSPALAECIRRALAPAVEERFQDCGSFGVALRGALDGGAAGAVRSAEVRSAGGSSPGGERLVFPPGHAHPDLSEPSERADAPNRPRAADPLVRPNVATGAVHHPEMVSRKSEHMLAPLGDYSPMPGEPCWFCGSPMRGGILPLRMRRLRADEWSSCTLALPRCMDCERTHTSGFPLVAALIGGVIGLLVPLVLLGEDAMCCSYMSAIAAFALCWRWFRSSKGKPATAFRDHPALKLRLADGWELGVPPSQ